LSKDEIGLTGDGKRTVGDRLTVGLVQTLIKGIPDELKDSVGTVILDEAHHPDLSNQPSIKLLASVWSKNNRCDGQRKGRIYYFK